jgi:hypothetical protein
VEYLHHCRLHCTYVVFISISNVSINFIFCLWTPCCCWLHCILPLHIPSLHQHMSLFCWLCSRSPSCIHWIHTCAIQSIDFEFVNIFYQLNHELESCLVHIDFLRCVIIVEPKSPCPWWPNLGGQIVQGVYRYSSSRNDIQYAKFIHLLIHPDSDVYPGH